MRKLSCLKLEYLKLAQVSIHYIAYHSIDMAQEKQGENVIFSSLLENSRARRGVDRLNTTSVKNENGLWKSNHPLLILEGKTQSTSPAG